jgi:excisionase family DNA binding protein
MLTPAEVASLFGVNPKTVTRWAVEGRLAAVRTPRGHRRYRSVSVLALLCVAGLTEKEAKRAVLAIK